MSRRWWLDAEKRGMVTIRRMQMPKAKRSSRPSINYQSAVDMFDKIEKVQPPIPPPQKT